MNPDTHLSKIDWPQFVGGGAIAALGGFLAQFAVGDPFLGMAIVVSGGILIDQLTSPGELADDSVGDSDE